MKNIIIVISNRNTNESNYNMSKVEIAHLFIDNNKEIITTTKKKKENAKQRQVTSFSKCIPKERNENQSENNSHLFTIYTTNDQTRLTSRLNKFISFFNIHSICNIVFSSFHLFN